MQHETVFARHEKKYMLDTKQYHQMRWFLEKYTQEDIYGQSTVCSLYYDTPQFDIIRQSIDKPVYKEKLRLRGYGTPGADSMVFLELKKKVAGVVYKRRVATTPVEAARYMESGVLPRERGQIFREVDWFCRMRQLVPQVMLCCERTALAGTVDQGLRVTFDSRIRWRDYDLSLTAGSHGAYLIPPDAVLMEIKTPRALPVWLCGYLSSIGVFPQSFSKYGTCYQRYLCGGEGIGHVG